MTTMVEDDAHELRSRANELFLRQEWADAASLYTEYIQRCDEKTLTITLGRHLCLALAHRAEARFRLRDVANAHHDVNRALEIDPLHPRSLFCKGKILLEFDEYSLASECFRKAVEQQPTTEEFVDALERSRMFEAQCRTGVYDLSEWVGSGYVGWPPQCAEYLGAVEIRSRDGERGVYVTKDVEAGTLLLVSKPLAVARGIILPDTMEEKGRLAIWKDFANDIQLAARHSKRNLEKIYALSDCDDPARKHDLGVPELGLLMANSGSSLEEVRDGEIVDVERILRIADINALTENGCGVKKLGCDLYGNDCVGLWVVPSFVNHSCCPSARRIHVGDAMFVHASRDLRTGDEVTFAYFDVLLPLSIRQELCQTWSFVCRCHRCELESSLGEHLREIDSEFVKIYKAGDDQPLVRLAHKLEQKLSKLPLQGIFLKPRNKQLIRASFASAYWPIFRSSVLFKRWGRQLPAIEVVVDSVTVAMPGDETALCAAAALVDKYKGGKSLSEYKEAMTKALKIVKALYGKQVKNNIMRDLVEAHVNNNGIISPKSIIR